MTTQFRDTQFGHLVRLASGNKLFLYPDEIDPSLWKRSVQRSKNPLPALSGDQHSGLEKPQDTSDSTNASAKDFDTQNDALNHTIEIGEGIYLVDWYGPDDPEVFALIRFHAAIISHTKFRIPKIGRAAGNY
jgi:DHA1 family multidrug resistance protein-like MFS transporter